MPGHSERSPLILSSPCAMNVNSMSSVLMRVSVFPLFLLCLALCVEGCCGQGEDSDLQFSVRSDQCTPPSENLLSDVSVNVKRKQEKSGWRTSDSSWTEGVWNKK